MMQRWTSPFVLFLLLKCSALKDVGSFLIVSPSHNHHLSSQLRPTSSSLLGSSVGHHRHRNYERHSSALYGATIFEAEMTNTVVTFLRHHLGLLKAATSTPRVIAFSSMMLLGVVILRRSITKSKFRNFLWPKYYESDPNFEEYPLIQDTANGCPFIGCNIISGNKKDGPEYFYKKMSEKLNNPKIWSFYSFGAPVASIVGSEDVTRIQNMEFSKLQIMDGGGRNSTSENYDANKESLFGGTNLMFETNKRKHRFLRGLVGSTMSPNALSDLVPTIQNIGTKYISKMLLDNIAEEPKQSSQSNPIIKMETICYDYTTEIVSNQILGFGDDYQDNPNNQIHEIQGLIRTWLNGMYSWLSFLPFIKKLRPAFKARQILTQKLEQQVDKIMTSQGQDGGSTTGSSTTLLQNMINAVHENEEDSQDDNEIPRQQQQQSLTREEVIQNTLLLVVAGTDNTTSTLVLLMLLLGLHPNVLQKLAEEQDDFLLLQSSSKKSNEDTATSLTYNQLMGDNTAFPYLDAVIKEALRMGPVTGGFPRKTTETIVFNGYQIPVGWYVFGNLRLSHILDPVTKEPNDAHMDPLTGFKPERWLSSETTPSEFLAFGAGPRYCLGVNLAVLELKIFVALLARSMTFELVNDKGEGRDNTAAVQWNPGTMVPRPLDGVLIRPKQRRP